MIETGYKRLHIECGKVCQKGSVSLERPGLLLIPCACTKSGGSSLKDTDIVLIGDTFLLSVPVCLDHISKWICAVAVEYTASSSPTEKCRRSFSVLYRHLTLKPAKYIHPVN